ncbi:hypothetical protein ERU29_15415 [Escherichia coli]|uniref:ead/Ea22-like family protein n=1 Tax=Escherichia coli TaxID=562 RepID=UPI000CF04748|nr:ead/Ea22-like family protein [Escherichia coli]EEY5789852.1 hypothetical protein [Escherichia coli]EFM4637643.1 ead/Ea22-like family protein [Escherichia coli]EFN4648813.1 ead/Ea22-like family protein [Escherichia coli]EKJ9976816.1 ead/Ea22-like family protein [Escherichia coli]MBL7377008.1 ead/Ea22-like family protein [Escherichia coli]
MSNIDKQALIAKIKKQTESFDTVVLKEDEANALLDELEAKNKRIAELEKRHAQVIHARDHYKSMVDERFRRINQGISLSINGEG